MNNLFEQTLEEVETLSDIPDNDLGVDDLSDDEPRLRLPNLKPIKKDKRKVSTFDEIFTLNALFQKCIHSHCIVNSIECGVITLVSE